MKRKGLIGLLLLSSLACVAETAWLREERVDALTNKGSVWYSLDGRFLTAPRDGSKVQPRLMVNCAEGKYIQGYMVTGAVLDRGGDARTLTQRRFDESPKMSSDTWSISNDGTALFFDKFQFISLLAPGFAPHFDDKAKRHSQVTIGVTEAFANQVVVQFALPQQIDEMVVTCGLEYGRKWKKELTKRVSDASK